MSSAYVGEYKSFENNDNCNVIINIYNPTNDLYVSLLVIIIFCLTVLPNHCSKVNEGLLMNEKNNGSYTHTQSTQCAY